MNEHPGITVNELARGTGLPKSRVSVLMQELGTAGQSEGPPPC